MVRFDLVDRSIGFILKFRSSKSLNHWLVLRSAIVILIDGHPDQWCSVMGGGILNNWDGFRFFNCLATGDLAVSASIFLKMMDCTS